MKSVYNSISPKEAKKGLSATTILAALVWAFSERDDLGEPVVATVAVTAILALVVTLVLSRSKT